MTHPSLSDEQTREIETRELLLPFIVDYFRELDRIAQKPPLSDQQLRDEALTALSMSSEFDWKPVYAADGKNVVGFYAFSRVSGLADFGPYLAEAYIIPSERHKGYMRTAISEYIRRKHITALCYAIQEKNDHALRFWERFFKSLDFTPLEITRLQQLPGGFIMQGWIKSNLPPKSY